MENDVDRLTAALRAIAYDDAEQAPRAIDPRILTELRAPRSGLPASQASAGRWLGFGIAATLASALAGSLWLVTEQTPAPEPAPLSRREVTTAFMPLVYSAIPYTDAQILRLEVPRAALKNFGLAPADVPAEQASAVSQGTVLADVLVGEDGLARAVRFVRAQRTE